MRKTERDSVNKAPSMPMLFHTLVSKPILHGAHRFDPPADKEPLALRNSCLPIDSYQPSSKASSMRIVWWEHILPLSGATP